MPRWHACSDVVEPVVELNDLKTLSCARALFRRIGAHPDRCWRPFSQPYKSKREAGRAGRTP